MVMLMPGLAKRDNRLPFAIGPRAQVVPPAVLGAPVTFVERGVGRACCRTGAFPDASVVSVVLAESAALVRTIHVVRKELAVPVLLALRLAGLHRKHAVDLCGNQVPRCHVRYCNKTCQHDHWRRGHKQMCKKIHRGGNAEQHYADKKYKEAVAVVQES